MGQPHIHAEVIKAWADGKQIQYRGSEEREWKDCIHNICLWLPSTQYRVKPETIRYRVGIFTREDGVYYVNTANTDTQAERMASWGHFIKWSGDWIEVEV